MSGKADKNAGNNAPGNKGADKPVRLRPRAPCPICGKPSVQRYHPFCSIRCADVDLGRWLGERYAVPAAEPGDEDEEADTPEPSSAPRRRS